MSPKKPPSGPPVPRRRINRILVVVALLATGSAVGGVLLAKNSPSPKPDPTPVPYPSDVGTPASAAGCGQVQRPTYQGRHRLVPEQSHPAYSSDPPTSGWFMPNSLPGHYVNPQPLERVMDTPAHGGVAIFFTAPHEKTVRRFYHVSHSDDLVTRQYRELGSGVAFVAWGVIQRCERFSGEAAVRFIADFGDWKAVKRVEPTASPVPV